MSKLKGMLYRKLKKVIDSRRKEKKSPKKDTKVPKKPLESIRIMDIIGLVKVQLICFVVSVLVAAMITFLLSRYDTGDKTLLTIVFVASLGTTYTILNSISSKIILK